MIGEPLCGSYGLVLVEMECQRLEELEASTVRTTLAASTGCQLVFMSRDLPLRASEKLSDAIWRQQKVARYKLELELLTSISLLVYLDILFKCPKNYSDALGEC